MLTRRELLTRGTTLLLLVPIVSSCSSSSMSSQAPAPPDSETGGTCTGIESTSTIAQSHDHMVCVPTTDLTNPPASGATYTTTNVSEHMHTMTLSQAQLSAIEAGTTVTLTTSSVVDPIDGVLHSHSFSIMKA